MSKSSVCGKAPDQKHGFAQKTAATRPARAMLPGNQALLRGRSAPVEVGQKGDAAERVTQAPSPVSEAPSSQVSPAGPDRRAPHTDAPAGSMGGGPLSAAPRAYFEPRFGRSFAGVHMLQRKACSCGGCCPACSAEGALQRKLGVGTSNDPLEREADRVMQMSDATASVLRTHGRSDGKNIEGGVNRKTQSLQPKLTGTPKTNNSEAPRVVHEVIRTPGKPLDPVSKAFFEPRFGYDFSCVRIHTDAIAAASARAVGALGYTLGEHIVFAEGHAPESGRNRQLLAHELSHIIQQDRAAAPGVLARMPDPQNRFSPLTPEELREILIKLLTSLKRRTQLSIMVYKTIAIGETKSTDENGEPVYAIYYTASGNWGSTDLNSQAISLGIQRLTVVPRDVGRGDSGAPADAEQLLIEGTMEQGVELLSGAVTRNPCLDCIEAIKDEDVYFVTIDPSEHLPKRQRRTKPSNVENNKKQQWHDIGIDLTALTDARNHLHNWLELYSSEHKIQLDLIEKPSATGFFGYWSSRLAGGEPPPILIWLDAFQNLAKLDDALRRKDFVSAIASFGRAHGAHVRALQQYVKWKDGVQAAARTVKRTASYTAIGAAAIEAALLLLLTKGKILGAVPKSVGATAATAGLAAENVAQAQQTLARLKVFLLEEEAWSAELEAEVEALEASVGTL